MIHWGIVYLEWIILLIQICSFKAILGYIKVWLWINYGGPGNHLFIKVQMIAISMRDIHHLDMLSDHRVQLKIPHPHDVESTMDLINVIRLGVALHCLEHESRKLEFICCQCRNLIFNGWCPHNFKIPSLLITSQLTVMLLAERLANDLREPIIWFSLASLPPSDWTIVWWTLLASLFPHTMSIQGLHFLVSLASSFSLLAMQ